MLLRSNIVMLRVCTALIVSASLATLRAPVQGDAPLQLTLTGVLGDRVSLGRPQQRRTTLVSFVGRRAPSVSTEFGRQLDERTIGADIDSVTVADVRRFGGWLRFAASSRLRKAAEDALGRRRARRQAFGVDASDEAVRRWHLVADFDGALFARFGVAPDPEHPVVFVIDRRGVAHGPYLEIADIVRAIDEARRIEPTPVP